MVKFTLKQCAYFVAVAEQGGIAQASRVLNISQPAVAQALVKLEELFGFRLFERHHARGTELTPEGHAFLAPARDLLQQAARSEQDAQAIAAQQAGIIRLGCFHTLAPFYLARLIAAHRDAYPAVKIESAELLQPELLAAIERGELDLALTYDMAIDHAAVERRVLTRLHPFLLLPANHRFATRTSIGLVELANDPFVMFDGPSSRAYFEGILSTAGIDPPIAFASKSLESVRSAVANGMGYSLGVMRNDHPVSCDGGRVATIEIADSVDPLAIVLLRRPSTLQPGIIEQFAGFCRDQFSARNA